MTHRTVIRQVQRPMVGIRALIKILRVTTGTGVGRVGIIPSSVAGNAVISHRHMRPCEWKNIVVIERGGRPVRLRVAARTVHRKLLLHMVRIHRLIEIRGVTACTGIGRVVVIPVVTGNALAGNVRMGAVQGKKVVVVIERCRHPARVGGVAGSAICGKPQVLVVRIGRLLEINRMAGRTFRRRTLVTGRMTGRTFCHRMRPCQWKIGRVMVKNIVHVARRMTGEAG